METLIRDHAWFLIYWGTLLFLGALEVVFPQSGDFADRKRRWPTNIGLGILNGLMVSSLPVLIVASAQWSQDNGFGLLNWLSAPWWIVVPCSLLVRSLASYVLHVTSHKIPLLWRLHRVHHCDVHLDVSSALRAHPLEVIVEIGFVLPVVVIFGLSPVVLAVYESVEIIAVMLTHANVRFPQTLERYARYLFVTPTLHRLHHSPIQVETDSNYGSLFSFWDRLFGTYRGQTIQSGATLRFGLDEVSRDLAGSFDGQLRLPFMSPTAPASNRTGSAGAPVL